MILIIIGITIRVLSIRNLKMKFFWRIDVPEKLCTTGLYKYIRNPMYLGTLLFISGISFELFNTYQALFLIYLYTNFMFDRIDREEQLLLSMYGEEYLKYYNNTKRLIPFIF